MSASRIRTSLASAPSSWTDEQKAARLAEYEWEVWCLFKAIVVRRTDPGMEFVVDGVAQQKFGKRAMAILERDRG